MYLSYCCSNLIKDIILTLLLPVFPLVVVVSNNKGSGGKQYRLASENDIRAFKKSKEELIEKQKLLTERWGFDLIPDEAIPIPDGKEYERGGLLYRTTSVVLYGTTKWRDLFNPRQKLALMTGNRIMKCSLKDTMTNIQK